MRRATVLALLVLILTGLGNPTGRTLGRRVDLSAGDGRGTRTTYVMRVLVLKYFPLTKDRQRINKKVTGDVGEPLSVVRARVKTINHDLVHDLTEASKYHGYKRPGAPPALRYKIVGSREHLKAVPTEPNNDPTYAKRPAYRRIMQTHHICSWVENRHVDEVWMWAYQGPHQLGISESKMAGPHGDISNSYELNDMPKCAHTYTVYTFNYGRRTAEAMESHGHQLEAELDYIDQHLFRDLFEGPAYPAKMGVPGRCGSVHNAPNARFEYDRDNPQPHNSDCLSWNPNHLGKLTRISCKNWSCDYASDSDNPPVRYLIWWMQNFPGLGNPLHYRGRKMRNWWDVHGAWDRVVASNKSLTL